ncbi:hypothetical protein F4775DRAFT_548352 [Biscogniauxia sp. FL1348]|nr:hypothetical protein F4775DRAFT_548352 [Biscogniauxia sp. FL1348]
MVLLGRYQFIKKCRVPALDNMIGIPQEILDLIVSQVNYEDRRNILSVSRDFQVATERLTWRYIHVNGDDIDSFVKLCTGHRTQALRNITFQPQFPNLRPTEEKKQVNCRPTPEEIRADNEHFSSQVHGMFRALKTVEERVKALGLGLPRIGLNINTPGQYDIGVYCSHRTYRSWRLRLLRPEELPELSWVRMLSVGADGRCMYGGSDGAYEFPLDLRMLVDLSIKLPGMEELSCPYLAERFPYSYDDAVIRHFTHPWEGPLRDSRHGLGAAVKEQLNNLPAGLKQLTLKFGDTFTEGCMDQSRALPNLVAPASYDPLSSGIRMLSRSMTDLDLQICADKTLFWPSPDEKGSDAPSWPHLERLKVRFHIISPSGAWYFQGPRGEGREPSKFEVGQKNYPPLEDNETDRYWDDVWDDEGGREENINPDMFRVVPNDEVIEPFLEAFARALGNMRAIKEAELSTSLVWYPSGERQARDYPDRPCEYLSHGTRWGLKYSVEKGCRNLEWQVGDWRPSESLHRLFRASCGGGGGVLEERWI